jgi:hypothetical protein
MRCTAVFAIVFLAAPLFAQNAERSKRLTTAAEQLLEFEKKMVQSSPDPIDGVIFGDVLGLLDTAVAANPGNLHAHALRAQLLLHNSYDGAGQYDICDLLDAKGDADYVISRAAHAAAADVTTARAVLRGIEKIPPEAIPDPPSACDDEDDGRSGTPTKSR